MQCVVSSRVAVRLQAAAQRPRMQPALSCPGSRSHPLDILLSVTADFFSSDGSGLILLVPQLSSDLPAACISLCGCPCHSAPGVTLHPVPGSDCIATSACATVPATGATDVLYLLARTTFQSSSLQAPLSCAAGADAFLHIRFHVLTHVR